MSPFPTFLSASGPLQALAVHLVAPPAAQPTLGYPPDQ
jgi:hypothetical protein